MSRGSRFRDIYPQMISGAVTQSAADTTTTVQLPLPISRLPVSGRVQVIEVLKIYIDNLFIYGTNVAETSYQINVNFTTTDPGAAVFDHADAQLIASHTSSRRGAFTAAGTYQIVYDSPVTIDLTDGSGHGLLIATDAIWAQCASTNTTQANRITFKIMYRFVTVGIAEYVGIVQSQQ